MLAYSIEGSRFRILLDKEEIETLKSKTVKGIIKIKDFDSKIHSKNLEILVEDLEKDQTIDLKFSPENATFNDIKEYILILSNKFYQKLQKTGENYTNINQYKFIAFRSAELFILHF